MDLSTISFLLATKEIEAFYSFSSDDSGSEWEIIVENLFQDHILLASKDELKILQDFIFLLYKDCKKALISPTQTLSFIDIVQQCFKGTMKLKYSEDLEANAINMFQTSVRKLNLLYEKMI